MLKRIKRILLLLVALIAVISGFKFSIDNDQPVQLVLFGWQFPGMPLGLWILSTLLLGCLLGLALSYPSNILKRRLIKAKDSKIRRLEEQLKKTHKN